MRAVRLATTECVSGTRGDQHTAVELISAAERAARGLEGRPVSFGGNVISAAQVQFYRLGAHWRAVIPQHGWPKQTAAALLAADRETSGELTGHRTIWANRCRPNSPASAGEGQS